MKIRQVKNLLKAYREKVFSLVLLPAFFLGTLPHTACIVPTAIGRSSARRRRAAKAIAARKQSLAHNRVVAPPDIVVPPLVIGRLLRA